MSNLITTPLAQQSSSILNYFKEQSARVDRWLDRLLPPANEHPSVIHEAIRYSIFAGGKRLRPILTIATGEVFGADEESLLPAACAIEMIHTYSLIHDDLPAMDNDNLRRGRPTNHIVYGEAVAILAGDALLTRAFQTLAEIPTLSPEAKVKVIAEVAQAAGTTRALIGGQVLDILNEGRKVSGAELDEIHSAKTGALIRCAVRIGAIAGGATEADLKLLTEYGAKAGLAFQIADDLLDETATSEELGKTAGKDAATHKATYATIHGQRTAKQRADQLCQEAIMAARQTGRKTEWLEEIAKFIVSRKS